MLRQRFKLLRAPFRLFRKVSWPVKIAMLAPLAALLAVGGAEMTSQSWFCNSCHIMNDYYASWARSGHSDVECIKCHLQPGFTGFVKGKINGLAQTVDCLVGRVGTLPNAVVDDASCLRPECHNAEAITAETVSFGAARFNHGKHLGQDVDGIPITCTTCHGHFEGTEHFSVNKQVCYSCHFLKSPDSPQRPVQAACTDCHEVPDKVIQQGLVKVNHAEFVTYNANCDDSCHRKQVETTAKVAETACLSCHPFLLDGPADSKALHETHSRGHSKIECFACHGPVPHDRTKNAAIGDMMACRNCHSDTHSVQKAVFTAGAHPSDANRDAIVLSPMFLTHVACADCHTKPSDAPGGALSSLGTVARATPDACDRCHEPGAGDRYVPFWQKQVRNLHASVTQQLAARRQRTAEMRPTPEKERALRTLDEAAALLDSVAADGSWGVHNFKYTEAILLKARDLLNSIEQ